jgi:putative nucleotidyltransferase with HDIG domain
MLLSDDEKSAAMSAETLLPIAVNTLCAAVALEFDLYIQPDTADPVLLYRERNLPLEHADLERLVEHGVRTLYILSADQLGYQRYLRNEVVRNERVPPMQRFQVLTEANRTMFEASFGSSNLDHVVQFTAEFGSQIADIVCHQDLVLADLFCLMEHDYYTYTHVLNVSTYSVALANKLGIDDTVDLAAIATGGLLHDIGKRHIQSSLLNKPSKLDYKQWKLIQQHPKTGFEEICLREDLNWDQFMMVYQHHERLNGQGYPVGVRGEEIHEWARMCSIADVFDALTTQRSYREANRIGAVLDLLGREAGKAYDREMVECWIKTMKSC